PQPPLRPPLRRGSTRQPPRRLPGRPLGGTALMQTHLPERAEAMIRRLDRATRRAGLDESAVSRVGSALRLALGRRAALLSDDHHPQFLHPARTALILLEDLG